MTDKIILELTLDELKTLDKHIEYNEETKSVFDKIKYAYPQLKMTLHQEGEYAIVSYNDTTYHRLMNETIFSWWVKKGVSANHPVPTLTMINDAETERLLEGLYYNHIEVKKEKEPEDSDWKTVALRFGERLSDTGPGGYYDFSAGEWLEWALNECEKEEPNTFTPKEIKELVKEGLEWCEDHPNENPLDWLTPKTPEETEESLKEAFREAVKQGVVSSTKSPTLYDVCMEWWEDAYSKNCIDDLINKIEAWLPVEQSAAGSQNAYVECTVEGFNDCLNKIKSKLR